MPTDTPAMSRPSAVCRRRLPGVAGRLDVASLTDRHATLAFARLGFAVAALVASIVAPSSTGAGIGALALPSALYAVVVASGLVAARSGPRSASLVSAMSCVVDALWLTVVVTPGGGAHSPLAVLVLVQAAAVAALAGGRPAVRAVACDVALLAIDHGTGLASRVDAALGVAGVAPGGPARLVLLSVAAAAVALVAWGGGNIGAIELRRSRLELEVFAAMAGALEGAVDADVCLEALLVHAAAALEARRGAVVRAGGGGLTLDLTATGTVTPIEPAATGSGDDVTGVVAEARRAGSPVSQPVLAADDPAAGLLAGARNVVACAVGHGGDVPVLLLEFGTRPQAVRMARRTRLVVGQFAAHAALALATVTALADRAREAASDPLTGLANRRQFDATLRREIATATRRAEPLSLALVDIDHFKAVNDRRGHLAGDEVLRRIAAVLEGVSRDMDLVARYGGEEFVLLLPSCSSVGALRVLRRVDAAIAADPGLAGITVSSGVATLGEHATDGISLVAAADEALYASKRAGRHRATVATRTVTPFADTATSTLPARRR